jgi:MFS family permease
MLTLLIGSTFLLAADLSLLNVAIPLLGDELGFALGDLQWVATSFALTSAGLTLFFGRIADLFGRRLLFLTGTALLVLASVVGGLAETQWLLIAARIGQGVATAITAPAALGLITVTFAEGPLRARALGANGAMVSAGFTAGALLSGLLTDLLSWRWAFWVNVPIGLVIAALTPMLLPESRVARRGRIDLPGAVTLCLGLGALVYGVSKANTDGWGSPLMLGLLGLAALMLVAFWRVESRSPAPLASVAIMRARTVALSNLGGLAAIAMQSGLIFLLTLYLQDVLRLSATATGLLFGVLGAGAFLGGVFAPRLIGRLGDRTTLLAGLALQVIGPGSLAMIATEDTPVPLLLPLLAIGAYGHVTAVVAYMATGTSRLPDEQQGLAAGLAAQTQQIALAIGIPVLSAVATGAGLELLAGLRLALIVNAVVVLAVLMVIAVGFARPGRPVE